MLGLELLVVLGVAVLAGNVLGERLHVAPPVLLLTAGVLLGFVPALRQVHLPPQAVLLLFLPALLYWESLRTSPREIRRNLRGIVLMSTALVICTAATVAAVAHAAGMARGPAWVLGAAVAPTDATAVGVLATALPRSNVTVLRAESLVNDGTALVIYGLAVGITVGEQHLTAAHVTGLVLLSYGGGFTIGIVAALLGVRLRRSLHDPLLGSTAMLLIPFATYLAAEVIGASGVLAVVVCGLIMSQIGPRGGEAETRRQIEASWSLGAFLLNGALFVLIGLQTQTAVRALTDPDLLHALTLVAVVSVALLAVRLAFLFASSYLIRLIDRRPQQLRRRISDRARIVSGISGFRGAVSLAAALAVPRTLNTGTPFPDRDQIICITAGVIVVTLLQALLLPGVVPWAHLPPDTGIQDEQRLAETTATQEALAALPILATDLGTTPKVTQRLRRELQERLAVLHATNREVEDETTLRYDEQYTSLRLALLARKRATVLRLRDQHRIDDTVLRQVQADLDIEEVRLSHQPAE